MILRVVYNLIFIMATVFTCLSSGTGLNACSLTGSSISGYLSVNSSGLNACSLTLTPLTHMLGQRRQFGRCSDLLIDTFESVIEAYELLEGSFSDSELALIKESGFILVYEGDRCVSLDLPLQIDDAVLLKVVSMMLDKMETRNPEKSDCDISKEERVVVNSLARSQYELQRSLNSLEKSPLKNLNSYQLKPFAPFDIVKGMLSCVKGMLAWKISLRLRYNDDKLVDDLVELIEITYNVLNGYYETISSERLNEIQELVLSKNFKLDPYTLSQVNSSYSSLKEYLIELEVNDSGRTYALMPSLETSLVLKALSYLLADLLEKNRLLSASSKGRLYRTADTLFTEFADFHKDFKVGSLLKLDLSESVFTLNRRTLIDDLFEVVNEDSIYDLIRDFLYLPINDKTGESFYDKFPFRLLPAYFLSDLLFHFYLRDFDKELHDLFEEKYSVERFGFTVLILSPQSPTVPAFSEFNEEIEDILKKYSLRAFLKTIQPGDVIVEEHGGIKKHRGLIGLSNEGRLFYKERTEVEEIKHK